MVIQPSSTNDQERFLSYLTMRFMRHFVWERRFPASPDPRVICSLFLPLEGGHTGYSTSRFTSSLQKQPSFFAPGPSGVSRESSRAGSEEGRLFSQTISLQLWFVHGRYQGVRFAVFAFLMYSFHSKKHVQSTYRNLQYDMYTVEPRHFEPSRRNEK